MSPPPAATFLAFHPQDNNIIAIGMEDSTVQIYNVRVDEVISMCVHPCVCGCAGLLILLMLVHSFSLTRFPVFGSSEIKLDTIIYAFEKSP